jgi:glycosyltransferase involved in cell wall biosynthesis
LLFSRFDLLLANDLDTLTANFLVSKIKNKPLVYDSHEYYTEVPELINRPRIQSLWESLERVMVPKLKYAYTVCNSIANIYKEKYGVDFKVVRNVPIKNLVPFEMKKGNNADKIVLYQGAVNIGRGLKQAILAMQFLDHMKLVIAGDGDIKNVLENLVEGNNLQEKVEFAGRLPIDELAELTARADLGLSIEEDLGLNYRFALPNKLFDYIQANVPVLITDLPEMVAVVKKYQIGEITTSLKPEDLAQKIQYSLTDSVKIKIWKENLKVAAKELVWEKEEEVLIEIFSQFLK